MDGSHRDAMENNQVTRALNGKPRTSLNSFVQQQVVSTTWKILVQSFK